MKIKLHIPTEQYGFAEFEFETEGNTQDQIEDAIQLYHLVKGSNLPSGEGLPIKVWNAVMDEYLNTGSVTDGVNLYLQMSPSQKAIMQEIKKCLKRIKNED